MLNDFEYWQESTVLHCFCTELHIMCLIQLVQLLGGGYWTLPCLDIWRRYQTHRDWFKVTFSKPKSFQILNFVLHSLLPEWWLSALSLTQMLPHHKAILLNFRKLTPNGVSVLAGHHHVKKLCYLNLVKRIYNWWWYILKCLLLCMVAVGNSGSTIETCRTLCKRVPHALWEILGVMERRRLCRRWWKDQNILVASKRVAS